MSESTMTSKSKSTAIKEYTNGKRREIVLYLLPLRTSVEPLRGLSSLHSSSILSKFDSPIVRTYSWMHLFTFSKAINCNASLFIKIESSILYVLFQRITMSCTSLMLHSYFNCSWASRNRFNKASLFLNDNVFSLAYQEVDFLFDDIGCFDFSYFILRKFFVFQSPLPIEVLGIILVVLFLLYFFWFENVVDRWVKPMSKTSNTLVSCVSEKTNQLVRLFSENLIREKMKPLNIWDAAKMFAPQSLTIAINLFSMPHSFNTLRMFSYKWSA